MTGTDYLLDSLLKLAGVDVDKAKAYILDLGKRFEDQDNLLREIHAQQLTIINLLNPGANNGTGSNGIGRNADAGDSDATATGQTGIVD